ncbi:MAG TPA: hypothetical protein VFJ82_11890, partial [Longimicrobium sp.]|nr:hypothetical protein [Longimicrobium sp.]
MTSTRSRRGPPPGRYGLDDLVRVGRTTALDAAPGVRTRAEAAAGAWLGALTLAGAVLMANTPGSVLRAYPLTSLLTMAVLAFGAVGSEAMWNARPWRYRAVLSSAFLALGPEISRMVDVLAAGDGPFPLSVRFVRWVLL